MRAVFTLTTLACLAVLAVASPASADGRGERRQAKHTTPRGDGPGDVNAANGKHNRGVVETNSPVFQRGTQHTSTENLGGVTNAQSAFCRNVRVCHITLQVVVQAPKQKRRAVRTTQAVRQDDGEPGGTAVERDDECCCTD